MARDEAGYVSRTFNMLQASVFSFQNRKSLTADVRSLLT